MGKYTESTAADFTKEDITVGNKNSTVEYFSIKYVHIYIYI